MESTGAPSRPYTVFYDRMKVLRDDFHRIGRFDDANAKLDELCKLFVLKHVSDKYPSMCGRSRLSKPYLTDLAIERFGDGSKLAAALHLVFEEMQVRDAASLTLFGKNPHLDIHPEDDEFAESLLPVLDTLPWAQSKAGWSFDLLNETFGHFVQDSFRHRKEDAQYLTPPEVVSAMVEMGMHHLTHEQNTIPNRPERLVIADPTCGVGSFLAATYCQAKEDLVNGPSVFNSLTFVGQDKVERMARLAKVNMQMFTNASADIRLGNSVHGDTLDDLNGQVDLVLTNPPFGASFERKKLFANGVDPRQFPILYRLWQRHKLPRRIDTEFLMFDRGLSLLRHNGRMLIVVPDKVVAADGFAADFRAAALEVARLQAVVDLPAETFAQAGTRTKTSIVHMQRKQSQQLSTAPSVLMATADDLGFRVASRAGVTVKRQGGQNQIQRIAKLYRQIIPSVADDSVRTRCQLQSHSDAPSVVSISISDLIHGRWNASFYRSERVQSLAELDRMRQEEFDIRTLQACAQIDPDRDVRADGNGGAAIISVLHVREDGFLDVDAVASYAPSSPTLRCQKNDVLLSRINPRIVRICVVPDLGRPTACSPEFAVLRCRDGVDPWLLALILRGQLVQDQIQALTSGTSSSHNRIKVRELAAVSVPIPRANHSKFADFQKSATDYRERLAAYYDAVDGTLACFDDMARLFAANPSDRE